MNITHCKDIYIYDENDNKYIDTRFGAGSFILGHTKEFNNKIFEQIDKGIEILDRALSDVKKGLVSDSDIEGFVGF